MTHFHFLPLIFVFLLFILIFCHLYSCSTIYTLFLPFIFFDFLFHKHLKDNNQCTIHFHSLTIMQFIDSCQDTKYSHKGMTEDSQYSKLGGDDEICLHLGLEISKISDCMPFTEIFPCSFGESAPSTVVLNHWHISLSYYSIVSIHLFHFPSPAILVICQPGVTTVNLSRSLSLNWADTPSCAQPQTQNSNFYCFYCFSVVPFVHPFVSLHTVTIWFLFLFTLLYLASL